MLVRSSILQHIQLFFLVFSQTCLQENDDQMGLQKLKTTLKEQGVNSVDTSKALYSLEEEGFICVDRSKRPTTVKLLMK